MITVIPRKIAATSVNGVAVANNGNVALPTDAAFGTCASAAAEQNKVVSVSDSNWQLKVGSIVGVKFSNSNTYSATAQNPCTLNVNGSGAKAVYYDTGVYTGTNSSILGYNNRTNFYMYDGTYWVWLNMGNLDGGADTVPSAYCTTDASTSAKTATCSNFTLAANSYVHILIQYTNTYDGAITLNINSTGAKPIYINGSASSSSNKTLPAGTYIIYYDGTNYYFRTDGMLPGNIEKVNGHTVGKDVPSDAVFTDTTYESKSAASGGTAVSLVTTGEKYTWNNKTDKVSGATSGNFAGLDANGNLTDSGSKASDFLTSHQDISGKVDKNQGVANAGKALGIGNDGMVTPVPFSGTDFTGATSSTAGTHGYVPAPAAGDQNKVLKGSGAWATVPETANEMPMSSSDSTTVKTVLDAVSNVVTEIPLTITPSSWSSTSPYTYTWTDSRVLSDSSVEVDVLDTSADTTADYIDYAKSSGGGGIVFTANKKPTANLSIVITITNAQAHAGSSIDADTVATDAISGASNVDEALNALSSKVTPMGNAVEIAHITASGTSTVIHDLNQYRYILFAYFSATYYRQTAIYHRALITGSVKGGYDNLLESTNRCYCVKNAYNGTTHEIELSTSLPSIGTWASGSFYIYGIK